ncbi:MAG: hypothetical protein QM778_18260 [Myxococcales bacterium]
MRELRRHHDERVLAVHVRGKDDDAVLVGRFGTPQRETSLGDAIRWTRSHPWGAQIVMLHAVPAARALLGIGGRNRFLHATQTMAEGALLEIIDDLQYVAGARALFERLPSTTDAIRKRVTSAIESLDPDAT